MKLKNILTAVFIICIVFLVISIAKNSLQILKAEQRLSEAQNKVDDLEKEKFLSLQDQDRRKTDQYLETQIRNKLKLVKPGESLVILPKYLQKDSEEDFYLYSVEENDNQLTSANWQAWLELFL